MDGSVQRNAPTAPKGDSNRSLSPHPIDDQVFFPVAENPGARNGQGLSATGASDSFNIRSTGLYVNL